MIYPSADKLEIWGSKYSLVVLASKRAKQLKGGALPMINTDSRNPLTVALEEIAAGKIACRHPDNDIIPTAVEEPEVAALLAIPTEERAEEAAEMAESEAGVSAAVTESAPGLEEELEDYEAEEEEEEEEEPPLYGDEEDSDVVRSDEEEHREEDDLLEAPASKRKSKSAAADADVDIDAVEVDDVEESEDEAEEE